MSAPTNYDISIYPLGQPGTLEADEWINWVTSSLTVQFTNGQPVKSLWFPNPQGSMSFYVGSSATGSPFYTTQGLVPELVPVPNDAPVVTVTGPPVPIWVYASTSAFAPFAGGAPPVINFGVTAPIINSGSPSAPVIGLTTPLPINFGGSGSSNPSLVQGANILITGAWPNQTIAAVIGAGGVQSITVNAPLIQTGSLQNPVLSLNTPLPIADGGTGAASAYLEAGNLSGLLVNGSQNVQDSSFSWVLTLGAFLQDNAGTSVSAGPARLVQNGGITVTVDPAHTQHIILDTTALVPVTGGITSVDTSILVTPHTGTQSVDLSVQSSPGDVPIYNANGTKLANPKIVRSNSAAFSVTYTGNVLGTTAVALTGAAAFSSAAYTVAFDVQGVSGGTPPIFVLEAVSRTTGGFNVTGYGSGGTGSGNITFDIICIGH